MTTWIFPDAKAPGKAFEEENHRLKSIVADQALNIAVLKEVNSKKW
jgi:putative transposase